MSAQVKPGFKTTEFWLTAIAQLVGLVTASGAFGEESVIMKGAGLILMALSAAGYSVSRGSAKKAA